jgi:hypothetical protein
MAHRYGYRHKQARKRYAREIEAGMGVCCRCSKPILPDDQKWHLDHDATGEDYLGAAHARCNLRAAGKVRARQLYGGRPYAPGTLQETGSWSRHWGDSSVFDERCRDCLELGEACRGKKSNPEGWPIGIGWSENRRYMLVVREADQRAGTTGAIQPTQANRAALRAALRRMLHEPG